MTLTHTLPSVHSLEAYIRHVSHIPRLAKEEEKHLAERLRNDQNLDSARQLILPHLYFVVKIARGYSGYGLSLADLIQEGNIGLMKAVKSFDPDREVRLVSFAVHWIRAEIHNFILRNWRIVRVATTKAQRKLFFNLRSRTTANTKNSLDNEDIARLTSDLDVSERDVREMEQRMRSRDHSFDTPVTGDASAAPHLYLTDERTPDPEQALAAAEEMTRLHKGLELLPDRSRRIIEQRWFRVPKKTLGELAYEYGLSAERIRQIEAQAFTLIRDAIGKA